MWETKEMSTPRISQTPLHPRGLRFLSFGCRDFLWITVIAGRSVGGKTACEVVTRYLRGGRGLSLGGPAPNKSNLCAVCTFTDKLWAPGANQLQIH